MAVVGAAYPNKRGPTRRFEIATCLPGEPVELVREPRNPADTNAVAVFSQRGVQMGYLTAERAPWIGAMLRRGREVRAVFHHSTAAGAVIRVAFDGAEPVLPRQAVDYDRSHEPVDDLVFWPDPIYDDT